MNLSSFGPALFVAGFAALAGVLYLLQRLRVRHRELRVPTVLFWKEAVEESRARVFVRRFRHPWAYALALAAAGLLWFAASGPHLEGNPRVEHLVVLDGSAVMTRGQRFADAVRAVEKRASELPRATTRVVFAAARPLTLLAPGEDLALLSRRMEGLAPESSPSTLADAVRAAAAVVAPGRRLLAELHGDGALDADWGETLPDDFVLRRVPTAAAESAMPPPGITAFGVSESASGRWDVVDLYARVEGAAAPLAVTVDGAPLAMTESASASGAEYRLSDVPARGGRWSARLEGDANEVGSFASRLLPERTRLRVGVSPRARAAAPSALAALAADSGVEITEEAPQVVLRVASEEYGLSLPALELVDAEDGQAAFTVRGSAGAGAEDEVLRLFERLGLREVDAVALADAADRAIELRFVEVDGARGIEVWATLLGAEFDFVQTRAFPLFLAASVRWLADAPELRADLAAGAWMPSSDAPLRAADGSVLDGAGAPFRLPRVGEWTDARGRMVTASLLDPALHAAAAPSFTEEGGAAEGVLDLLPWIAVLALAAMVAEWILFRRGRIP